MKIHTITLAPFLSWLSASAEEPDPRITQVCSDQARDVMLRVNSDVLPDMTADQRSRIAQIANDACLKHMAAARQGQADETRQKQSKDWFTDYLLNGEAPNKPGNKRLKTLKR